MDTKLKTDINNGDSTDIDITMDKTLYRNLSPGHNTGHRHKQWTQHYRDIHNGDNTDTDLNNGHNTGHRPKQWTKHWAQT